MEITAFNFGILEESNSASWGFYEGGEKILRSVFFYLIFTVAKWHIYIHRFRIVHCICFIRVLNLIKFTDSGHNK